MSCVSSLRSDVFAVVGLSSACQATLYDDYSAVKPSKILRQ
jgi:hypothetical protein